MKQHNDPPLGETFVLEGGQTQVSDFDGPRGTRDENIITFEISMDDRWFPRVEELQTLEKRKKSVTLLRRSAQKEKSALFKANDKIPSIHKPP